MESTTKKEAVPPFSDVEPRVNSDELEQQVLAFWDTEKVFEKSLEQNKDKELFTFYDGPPYATGKPHYGHILQSSIKDTVLRFKTMEGYYAPRRVGWDTHGLPIENIVEKELGITSKRQIEDDIEAFNKKCRETVYHYVDEFTSTLKRMGRWAEYENAYSTLDRDYMESEWWVFKQLWEKELVYKDFRSTAYCIRCATPLSNFEVGMGYKDVDDTAIYVAFPVVGQDNLSLLIWTTTPWTLPGNAAVAFHPDIAYVVVEVEGKQYILARDRVESVFGKDINEVRIISAEELSGLTYTPPYNINLSEEDRSSAYRVVAGEHVTAVDGTGLVHTAPAFGDEDFQIGKKYNLPTLRMVDTLGNFNPEVEMWAGQPIFAANPKIVDELKERGLLIKQETYRHSYPFCWRCDTPLIYYALDSWFLRVTELKDQMLQNNEQISWVPEHIKQGRFAKGIESAPDWAISRNRFWSVPMPIWQCNECDHRVCIGSVEELQTLSGTDEASVADLHRPYVDDITWECSECGKGTMKRIPEVLDVWFDAGSMPYAQWHYPFENKDFVEKGYPADFIVESIEMTRAWFYVLHVLAAALTKDDVGLGTHKPAFKNAIGSGIIFAEDGRKLSKKLKNYPEIEPTMVQYGADILRFYLLTSSRLGEPYRFSEKDLRSLRQNVYSTFWNVYSFFVRYANVHEWTPENMKDTASEHILDQWIVARTGQLEREVMEAARSYHVDMAARLFIPYVDDLSNWYLRRSRARFQKPEDATERDEAFSTLYQVLRRVVKLLAPFMPFVAEAMYRNIVSASDSVHLQSLPKEISVASDEEQAALSAMSAVRSIVSEGLAIRARSGIKIRQPLMTLVIQGDSLPAELVELIQDEVNVKEVVFGAIPQTEGYARSAEDSKVQVGLHTEITEELKAEGIARDVIRHGQMLRRNAGYALDDAITLSFVTDDETLKAVLEQQQDTIAKALQALDVKYEAMDSDASEEVKVSGSKITISVKK